MVLQQGWGAGGGRRRRACGEGRMMRKSCSGSEMTPMRHDFRARHWGRWKERGVRRRRLLLCCSGRSLLPTVCLRFSLSASSCCPHPPPCPTFVSSPLSLPLSLPPSSSPHLHAVQSLPENSSTQARSRTHTQTHARFVALCLRRPGMRVTTTNSALCNRELGPLLLLLTHPRRCSR